MANKKTDLPYTRTDEKLNSVIKELMEDFASLLNKARSNGLDIRLYPYAKSLSLYFNDDYPDTLLVDKFESCKMKGVTGNEP